MKLTKKQKDSLARILDEAGLLSDYRRLRREYNGGLKVRFPEKQKLWAYCWGLAASHDPFETVLRKGGWDGVFLTDEDLPDRDAPPTTSEGEPIPSGPTIPCDEEPKIPINHPASAIISPAKPWEIAYDDEDAPDSSCPDIEQEPKTTVLWAMANLRDRKITRKEAPNATAWTILYFARTSREHLEKLMASWFKLVSTKDTDDAKALLDDGRKILGTVDELLNKLLKKAKVEQKGKGES